MVEFTIRKCTREDFSEILKLLRQLWPDKEIDIMKTCKVYKKAIVSENQHYLCAVAGGDIIGFCSLSIKNNLWQEGNLAHIDEIVVNHKYRGQGIGQALLEQITNIAKDNHCKKIELDSAYHREEAHQFYEKTGYENRAVLFSKTL